MNSFEEQDRLNILKELAINYSDPEKKLIFSVKLLKTAQALDSTQYLFVGYTHKGIALREKGDFTEALQCHFQAAEIAIKEKDSREEGLAYITIADVYSQMGNHNNSIDYYQRAIHILREENDSIGIAKVLFNAGDEYLNIKEYDSALIYFDESSLIFKRTNFLIGTAYNLGNIGMVYAYQGKYILAKQKINEAIQILEGLEIYSPISAYLMYMSDIYNDQNDITTALSYAQRSLELAQKYGLKRQISDANLKLSQLYEQDGNMRESIKYYKNHIAYRDSVNNLKNVQQIANLRTDFEVSRKQIEVDLLNQKTKNQKNRFIGLAIILVLMIVLMLTLFWYFRNISKEKKRSVSCLQNILPSDTAQELMKFGKVKAKKFDSVTVLFTDFQAFTHYSQDLSPEKLVKSVDYYFSKFDKIIEKYGLEKIKTIGDAYMCVGGLPFPTNDHSLMVLLAAFDITKFVTESKKVRDKNIAHFDVRIGINTGPVVAGVVGIKKFAYDIWGDTVNVASRMESMSEPGKINISESTYDLIKHKYDCEYRGKFKIKNKGLMKMYFVNGLKENIIHLNSENEKI
ncbi:MAG: adenylate/guanylate cyclase domain-containing protein [Bacteroidota bacterium]